MEWFTQYLSILEEFLVGLGVPPEQGPLAALGLAYLLLTLLLLLFILLLIIRSRTRTAKKAKKVGQAAEAEQESAPEPRAEADAEERKEQAAEIQTASGPPAAQTEEPVAPLVEEPPSSVEVVAETPVEEPVRDIPAEEPAISVFDRLRQGLNKTRSSLIGRVDALLGSHARLDDDFIEELEEILITADFGMQATQSLVEDLTKKAATAETDPDALRKLLADEIRLRLASADEVALAETGGPLVFMIVGVNGVGKTTTIGKLARQFTREGKKVVVGAGDTFRAAAAEQLQVWGERAGAEVICHAEGADPSAVAFDAAKAAVARKADVLIVDTAGRLHTKVNLMEELRKMRRVLGREIPGAPHETLLVLDATTGQNALVQAIKFQEAVEVTGVVLTKLDGTAKGGIVVAINSQLQLPIRYIGVGEGVDDLRPFDPDQFVDALFLTT